LPFGQATTPKHRLPLALRASGSLLFACAKRSNQEKAHPRMSPSAHPALRVRVRGLCSADCASMHKPRNRRDPSRRPYRASRPRPPPCEGAHRAARIVRAEATAEPSKLKRFCFGAQERAALASRGPHRMAAAADDPAPQGARARCARLRCCTRTYNQRNPAADVDPQRRMRAGRYALGRVLLVTFSCTSKKGNSLARRASESWCSEKSKNKRHRIPAFAGMTGKRDASRNDGQVSCDQFATRRIL